MPSNLRHIRHDERGFSLMELLTAMVIGSVVLTAVMSIFLTGISKTAQVNDRVEAAGRARLAADRAVTLLDAQTCVDGISPLIDAQADQVTFFANLGTVDAEPKQYRLRYDAAADTLYEEQFDGARVKGVLEFPAQPNRTRVLGTGLLPVNAAVFTYYKFLDTGVVATTPLSQTATGLSVVDRQQVVRVGVGLNALPSRTTSASTVGTTIDAQATVASADPSNPTKGPNC
jgi:prepilin-type N-terminal cleavage/methylation domain-containing protein